MKFEMELHPNFVSDIVVKQLQEMYEHTKEAYFYTDPVEARAAIAVVLDYFMPPSDYEQWKADNGFDRNLAEEVAEGFGHLEKKRSREEFLEDLYAWANKPYKWVDLTEDDIQAILKEWVQTQMTVREMLREAEAKLKEKNTVAL